MPPGVTTGGDPAARTGFANHVYLITKSMIDETFYNADGEMLFVLETSRLTFLTEFGIIDAEPGEIVHLDGRVLGRHQGIARYTVGQGRGLGQASRDGEEPLFVTGVQAGTRRVVVGPRQALPQAVVEVGEVNWLVPPPEAPLRSARARLWARRTSPAPADRPGSPAAGPSCQATAPGTWASKPPCSQVRWARSQSSPP